MKRVVEERDSGAELSIDRGIEMIDDQPIRPKEKNSGMTLQFWRLKQKKGSQELRIKGTKISKK